MSDFLALALAEVEKATVAANTHAERLKTADNSQILIHEYRDEAETADANILAYREWFEKATAAILAKQAEIENYIVSSGFVDTTPVDVEAETAAYKAARDLRNALISTLKNLPGGAESLESLPELKSIPGTRKSGGATGTGIARPRLAKIMVGTESVQDANGKSTISVLCKWIAKTYDVDVEVSDIHKAMFDAAGTRDLSTLNGKPVEFALNVKEGVNILVTAFPSVKE